jgi:hypothetical protein
VRATARDGRTIDVRRRWLPWRPRVRDVEGGDVWLIDGADDVIGFVVLLVLSVAVSLVLVFLLPPLVFIAEALVVAAAIPVATALRILLIRPWTIEARHEGTLVGVEKVRGWRASQQRIQEIVTTYERSVDDPFTVNRR